jgi:hypothetical protein
VAARYRRFDARDTPDMSPERHAPFLAELLSVLQDGEAPFAELYRFIAEPLEPRPTVDEAFSAVRDALAAGWIKAYLNVMPEDRPVSPAELNQLNREYAEWLSPERPLPPRRETGFDPLRLFLELTPAGRDAAMEIDAHTY